MRSCQADSVLVSAKDDTAETIRRRRLAEALRDNLRKRKAQARARAPHAPGRHDPAPDERDGKPISDSDPG